MTDTTTLRELQSQLRLILLQRIKDDGDYYYPVSWKSKQLLKSFVILKQAHVVRDTKLDRRVVARFMKGEKDCTIDTLARIGKLLDVQLAWVEHKDQVRAEKKSRAFKDFAKKPRRAGLFS